MRSLRRWPCPHHIALGPPAPIRRPTMQHTNGEPSRTLCRRKEVNRKGRINKKVIIGSGPPAPTSFPAQVSYPPPQYLPPGSPSWAGVRPSGKPICDRSSLDSAASLGPGFPPGDTTGHRGQSNGNSKRRSSRCPCRLGSPQLQRAQRRAGPPLWTYTSISTTPGPCPQAPLITP